jgi:hypothetical protein
MDYYYMLGLPREAIAAQIETRAASIIARFSSAAFQSAPQPVQQAASEIRRALIEAHSILSCPDSRRAYDAELGEGRLRPSIIPRMSLTPRDVADGPPRPSVAPMRAADTLHSLCARNFYQQAEQNFEAGDFQQARLHLSMVDAQEPGSAAARDLLHRIEQMEDSLRQLSDGSRKRMATSRNKTDRMALERMYGVQVWEELLSNPELTATEVARIAVQKHVSAAILESIVGNETWIADAAVREALLMNPSLGKPLAMKVLARTSPVERRRIARLPTFPPLVRRAAEAIH